MFFFIIPGSALAGDYHIGSQNLYCSDCHTMHYSQDGTVPSNWGAEGPYANLLLNLTNEMCLMCHDGTNPAAPNVMGEDRYVSSAGKFKATNPGQQHSLGGTDAPPGYSGTWGGAILTCVSCHNPHGNPYYRNLRPDPGGVPDITLTYETGIVYGGEAAIQQQAKTPLAGHYSVENILFRQTESGANYGLSPWCAGCHTDYYGNGGDTNMGGSPSGDTQASGTDTWIRHPTIGITLSEGVTNLHIDGEAENGTGYWWSSQILSRPPYISPSGMTGTKSSTDNEAGCNSCHKAHGSDQKDCLLFDDPETDSPEDGLRMVGTCQSCHLTGGGYYETSPHGDSDDGLLRLTDRPQGDCQQCHKQHQGNPYNLFMENTNYLCFTTGCHDFTPSGGSSGYPAQEEDRAPAGTTYTGYFEYFSGGSKAPGLNNRVRWPGKDVFEDPNTYITGPIDRYFSPHRNDPDMPRRDASGSGMCLNCHSPHGTENPFDMLVETYLGTKGSKNEDVPENYLLCFGCHSSDGPSGMDAETKRIADYYDISINPSTSGHMIRKSAKSASYWPPHIQEGDRLACSNCHNPHGSRGHYNNNQPNARLISDQRSQWNGIVDTLSSASKCRSFCFGCHVPSDDPNCSLYSDPDGCPEVDGIKMKAIPALPGAQTSHKAGGDTHCTNCHGRNYDATTSASPAFNVHNPKPSPGGGGGQPYRMTSAQVIQPPIGFAANPGMRMVELYWIKYSGGDIRGYNLYRSQSPGGPYALLASEPDCIYRYIDRDVVPERNYYYVLTVEDLNGAQSPYSQEAGATPMSITPGQLSTLEQIKQLAAKTEEERIFLTWEESTDELVAGYHVYRRTEGGDPKPFLLTKGGALRWPVYEDREIEEGNIYIYSVVAVDRMGNEARFPREARAAYKALFISSVSLSQGERPLKGGDEMTVTLAGSNGVEAYFDIEGLAQYLPMEEVGGTGTYTGTYIIPREISEAMAGVTCFLKDSKGDVTSMHSPSPLMIDNQPPPPPVSLEVVVESDGGVSLNWAAAGGDTATYRVYRFAGEVKDPNKQEQIASNLSKGTRVYKDTHVLPGTTYHYNVTVVDEAGNESPPSVFAKVVTPEDKTPPIISDMQFLGGMGIWRPGEEIVIMMTGEPFCRARFSIGEGIRDIAMEELPGGGRYKGIYTFRDGDLGEEMQLAGVLTDQSGNSVTYEPRLKVSVIQGTGGQPPVIYEVQENSFQTGGDEGLVTGDVLQIRVNGTPGCNGAFHLNAIVDRDRHVTLDWSGFRERALSDISGYGIYHKDLSDLDLNEEDRVNSLGLGTTRFTLPDGLAGTSLAVAVVDSKGHPYTISTPRWDIPLQEAEEKGVYQGEYAIKPGDKITQGYMYVSLFDKTGTPSLPYQSPHTITIDTGSRIEVKPYPPELRADRSSSGRVQITLKDARGKGVPNRETGLALFTTSEYTSLSGLGRLNYIDNYIDIGGVENMLPVLGRTGMHKEPYIFTTDDYGRIEVEYQAGFAAKTLIFRVRDLITGDIGTGYVTSYIEGQAQAEQYLPAKRMKESGQKYAISLSSVPEWLTADGISTARIEARVTDENGEPVKGHRVVFTISMGDGSLMRQEAETDPGGVADVVYRAGTRIGTVEIRGVDIDARIEAKTYIILKSDAPAMISIRVEPERIPADGMSQCRLLIKVTDINGNPSRGAGISLTMDGSQGGRIVEADDVTDFLGQAEAVYQAGTGAGKVLFSVRTTSKVPSPEETEEIIWAR